MVSKYMERGLPLITVREVEIKTTIRVYLTAVGMVIIKKQQQRITSIGKKREPCALLVRI